MAKSKSKFNHTKSKLIDGEPPEKINKCKECDNGFLRCVNAKGDHYVHLCRLCRGHGRYEALTGLQIRKAKYWNSLLLKDWEDPQPYLKLPEIG